MLGILLLRMSGDETAAVVATALVGLRQSVSFELLRGVGPLLGILTTAFSLLWFLMRGKDHCAARLLKIGLMGLGLFWTLGVTEWVNHTWVPRYVGARTALQGSFLHLLSAYVALLYASAPARKLLFSFWALWTLMTWSYEQSLCLPLAAAPAFLITVPRARWRTALPLLLAALAMTLVYIAIRVHFLQVYGVSRYQMLQLRSGRVWLVDLLTYALPPALVWHLVAGWTGLAGLVFSQAAWVRLGETIGWFWAYAPAVPRLRLLGAWYWWRVVAYLPLLRFHQHGHYSYLAQLATAACHGLCLSSWARCVEQQWWYRGMRGADHNHSA
jgi:hypothetical protein